MVVALSVEIGVETSGQVLKGLAERRGARDRTHWDRSRGIDTTPEPQSQGLSSALPLVADGRLVQNRRR